MRNILGSEPKEELSLTSLARELVDCANDHSQDTGEEHWKGDLDQVLLVALKLMNPMQLQQFLRHEDVQEVLGERKRKPYFLGDVSG